MDKKNTASEKSGIKVKTFKRVNHITLKPIHTTSARVQRDYILMALNIKPFNTIEFRELGIFHCAARIRELRSQGHNIQTFKVTVFDDTGLEHRNVACYVLLPQEVHNDEMA